MAKTDKGGRCSRQPYPERDALWKIMKMTEEPNTPMNKQPFNRMFAGASPTFCYIFHKLIRIRNGCFFGYALQFYDPGGVRKRTA